MKKRHIMILIPALLLLETGVLGLHPAYAEANLCQGAERDITFPEFRLISAVNDAGNTVKDTDESYCFHDSMKVTLEVIQDNDSEDGESERFVIRRDETDLDFENGYFTDEVNEEGEYIYKIVYETADETVVAGEEILTVRGRKMTEQPSVSVKYLSNEVNGDGNVYFSDDPEAEINIASPAGIAVAEYRSGDGAYEIWKDFRKENASYVYGEQTEVTENVKESAELSKLLTGLEEGSYDYTFRVTDVLGKTAETSMKFIIDQTAPDQQMFVSYVSDGTNKEASTGTGIMDFLQSAADRLFGKTEVWFDLYATDGGSDKQSGIDVQDLSEQILTAEGNTTVRKLQVIDESGASFTYNGKQYKGYTHIRGCMMMLSGCKEEVTDRLQIKRLKDCAGNVTENTAESFTGTTVIYLDQTNPEFSVDYGKGIVDEAQKTVFYQDETILNLVLNETNYLNCIKDDGSPATPLVRITDNGNYGAEVDDWQLQGRGQVCASLLLPAASEKSEAVYNFTVEYQDGSGNFMELDGTTPGNIKNGIYTGCTVVIDNRPPELVSFSVTGDIAGQHNGINVYHQAEKEDVRFTFAIDDHTEYWNPEAAELIIQNMDTKETVVILGNTLQWKENGRIHLAEYAFDGEKGMGTAVYQATLSYEDRAGNRMVGRDGLGGRVKDGIYTDGEFLLDHEAPVFNIAFNDAVRLVKEDDTAPSRDIRDSGPQTGYTAYYSGAVEVSFSLQERCAVPVCQGKVFSGLQGFDLTVTGKNGNFYQPKVSWNKDGDFYEGRFILAKEDSYRISAAYKDMAGNGMVSETVQGSRWGSEDLPAGKYESVLLVIDRTAPKVRISYVDIKKREKPAEAVFDGNECTYFSQPVYLKLEMEDAHLRFSEIVHSLQKGCAADSEGNMITEHSMREFLDKLEKAQISEKATWFLPLMTEAVYEIPLVCTDLSGNFTELPLERVCVDGTKPKMELSYSVEKAGFLDVVRYRDFRYLFADGRMTVKATAQDQISGIHTICYKTEEENGKIHEYIMNFEPTDSGEFEIIVPSASSDFKGSVTAEVQDWSGNSTIQKCGHIVEDDERHRQEGAAVLITDTSPSRTVNGTDYYNTDIRFQLLVKDTFSGLKNISCKGGETIDYIKDYGKEETGIVYDFREELVLDAASNNENGVPVRAEYQDHAGHIGMAEKLYNIDVTIPVIQVKYNNNQKSDKGLYDRSRTATVTIRERNFDSADVEFKITNTDGVMPSIGEWKQSGTGDDTLHVCDVEFFADGDYTFTLDFTDLAGNRAQYEQVDRFTIDRTSPVLTVKFDHVNARNNKYFAQKRTAMIDILEHNFDSSLIHVVISEQNGKQVPYISKWNRNGDHHTAFVVFETDGDYALGITGMDLAGNVMNTYAAEHFIIDQTAPELEISGLEDRSANQGVVAPEIRCTDSNYQKGSMKILLKGCRNGRTELKGISRQSTKGELFSAENFVYEPEMDDLYQLQVSVCDLAGNVSRKEIQFSVNRFGSVYTLDDKTELLAGERGVYYTKTEQDIIVTETNVDTLEFQEISCSRDGKLLTLQKNKDYFVRTDGTDTDWRQYTYTVPARNFAEEGTYILKIYSEDRAKNRSDNQTKGKKIEFVIDKTAPSILLSGLEDGGLYRDRSKEITLDIQDNVRVSEVKVDINGVRSTYHASEVQEKNGRIILTAGSSAHWQTIGVTATDAAGNKTELEKLNFLLTPNILIQFFMNRTWFCSTVIVLLFLWGAGWQLFFRRKRQ